MIPTSHNAALQRFSVGPIQHDFTAAEYTLAHAAYETFVKGRAHRPWAELRGHEQFRWLLCGALVWSLRGNVQAQAIRARYHIASKQLDWEGLGSEYKARWLKVALEMQKTYAAIRGRKAA